MAGRPRQSLVIATLPSAHAMVELSVADTGRAFPPRCGRSSFSHSSRPRVPAWEWGCRSATRSSKRMAAGSGPKTIPMAVLYSGSPCPAVGRSMTPRSPNLEPPREESSDELTPPADVRPQRRRTKVQ